MKIDYDVHVPHSAHKGWLTITSRLIEVRTKAKEIAAGSTLDLESSIPHSVIRSESIVL